MRGGGGHVTAVVTWVALMTSAAAAAAGAAESQAKRLYDDKLTEKSTYKKLIRPVDNTSESLTVHIGLRLTSIIDVVSQPTNRSIDNCTAKRLAPLLRLRCKRYNMIQCENVYSAMKSSPTVEQFSVGLQGHEFCCSGR